MFITETPLLDVIEHIKAAGYPNIEEVLYQRTGLGPIKCQFTRDPDNNLLETS